MSIFSPSRMEDLWATMQICGPSTVALSDWITEHAEPCRRCKRPVVQGPASGKWYHADSTLYFGVVGCRAALFDYDRELWFHGSMPRHWVAGPPKTS